MKRAEPKTHLGTRELHRRHSVMIEGGTVPRAKVMDQTLIDRYLMDGLLTLPEHHGGEFLLKQAAKAGVWAKGINWSGGSGDKGTPNYVPFGAFPYGSTIRAINNRFGEYHGYLAQEVVCFGWDIRADDTLLGYLKEALGFVRDWRVGGRRHPVDRLRAATKKARTEVRASSTDAS